MHPILFSIGTFFIGTYGLMLVLGLVLASSVALWRAKKIGVSGDNLIDLIFFGILFGIIGGRVTFILVNFRQFLENPAEMIFSRADFVFLGGLIFAIVACVIVIRRRHMNVWLTGDILMAAVPLGHAFGRIGCFAAGCCYGRIVSPGSPLGWLGVRFPAVTQMGAVIYPGLAFEEQKDLGLIAADAAQSLPVWPTQLFESLGNLVIFGILFVMWKRRRFNGQIVLLYAILYSILRFSLEFLRGDMTRGGLGGVSTSQIITMAGFAAAIIIWPILAKRRDLSTELVAIPVGNKPANRRSTANRKDRRG